MGSQQSGIVTLFRVCSRLMAGAIAGLVLLIAVGEGIEVQILTSQESVLLVAMFLSVSGMVCMVIPPYSQRRRVLFGAWLSVGAITAFYGIHFWASGRFPGGWVFPTMSLPGVIELVCHYGLEHVQDVRPPEVNAAQ